MTRPSPGVERAFEESTNHELRPQGKLNRQASYREARARYEDYSQAFLELLRRRDDSDGSSSECARVRLGP